MMNKTEMQIERDFYSYVKNSAFGKAIKGGIYRSEMRPSNATSEDMVVKFLAGLDEQFQTGVVIINTYVPDIITTDGRPVADKKRIGELQELIYAFVDEADGSDYWISLDGTPQTMTNEDIGQNFIYTRLKFKSVTF